MENSAIASALNARRDQSLRVPYYCEENVWRLAYRKLQDKPQEEFFVTFIANPRKCVPMFHQLASGGDPDKPCCWDYHVILHSSSTIYDIDCTLKYPCDLHEYIIQVFPSEFINHEEFRPWFRVIKASVYLEHFSSDRMHMYDKKCNKWNAPPPTYPCIKGIGGGYATNLEYYMTISSKDIQQQQQQQSKLSSSEDMPFGKIYNLLQFKKRFGSEKKLSTHKLSSGH